VGTAELKLYLAKKIIETEDLELINYIKSIFDGEGNEWYDDLPSIVQESLQKGLKQSSAGEGQSHEEVMKKYQKWQ